MTLLEPYETPPDTEIGKGLSPFHVTLSEAVVASTPQSPSAELVGVIENDTVAGLVLRSDLPRE